MRLARFLVPLLLVAAPAQAAPPASFAASGTALSYATAETPAQTTPIKLFYQGGKVRLELEAPEAGTSILLAKRGSGQVTMLVPAQKLAFTASPKELAGPDAAGMPDMEQLLDLTSWKAQLQKSGKRLAGSEMKAGERCSLWEKPDKSITYKVWYADALELPLQLEGYQGGKPRFRISVTRFSPGPQSASLFTVPAGYQTTEFTQQKL